MKEFRSFIGDYWLTLGMVLGVLAPGVALASKGALSSLAQEACEAKARATFKKRAVEMEMALIAGSLNELELSSKRESLQVSLRRESASCASHGNTASRSSAEEGATSAL